MVSKPIGRKDKIKHYIPCMIKYKQIRRRKAKPGAQQLNSVDQLCSSQPLVWRGCLLWLQLCLWFPFHCLKKFSIVSEISIFIDKWWVIPYKEQDILARNNLWTIDLNRPWISSCHCFKFYIPASFPFMKAWRAWPRDSMWRTVWVPASRSMLQKETMKSVTMGHRIWNQKKALSTRRCTYLNEYHK